MSESTLLAQIMRDNSIYYQCGLTAEDFSSPSAQRTFRAIGQILDEGQEADELSIFATDKNITASYLSGLNCASPRNWKVFAKSVKSESEKRNLQRISWEINDSLERGEEVSEIKQKVEEYLTAGLQKHKVLKLSDILPGVIDQIEEAVKSGGKLIGYKTNLVELDGLLDGIQPLYYIIGGRPSTGKSALGFNLAYNLAKQVPVGIVSAEMDQRAVIKRMVSFSSRVPLSNLKNGLLSSQQKAKLSEGIDRVKSLPIYFDDTPNIKLDDLKSSVRSMSRQYGIKACIVDYLGLINYGRTTLPRYEQISIISRELKRLSRELEIAVIALAQVNRDAEDKLPTLANLRESGSLEQDADAVIFTHHNKNNHGEIIGSYLVVAKQRDGATGIIEVKFDGDYTKFNNMGVVSEDFS